MGNFNRGRSGGGRGFSSKGGPASGWERRGFSGRGSSGPAQMYQATCDKCQMSCEVPFRPTNGRPVYCSSCFENNGGSDSRRFEGRNSERTSNFDERQMFDAVCDNCGKSCRVPFRPSSGKPIYCSNCFGEKKEGGSRNNQQNEQFEQINSKLDKILLMLTPNTQEPAVSEEKVKPAKKKSPKKK